jgi:hypothetical protein
MVSILYRGQLPFLVLAGLASLAGAATTTATDRECGLGNTAGGATLLWATPTREILNATRGSRGDGRTATTALRLLGLLEGLGRQLEGIPELHALVGLHRVLHVHHPVALTAAKASFGTHFVY